MSPSLQAKFLRILQDGALKRIGGKAELRVDVRVLAATNRDPAKSLKDGTLREDLYYRLNVFTLMLPAAPHAAGGHPAPRPGLHRGIQRQVRA